MSAESDPIKVLFRELALPNIVGLQLLNLFMLEEALVTLLKSGVLTDDQVEDMLTHTSERIADFCDGFKATDDDSAQKIRASADHSISLMRHKLFPSPPEHD